MRAKEFMDDKKDEQIKKFIKWACEKLKIDNPPKINLTHDSNIAKSKGTFGTTSPDGEIWVHVGNRTVADAMRTISHELIHYRQFQKGIATEKMKDEQLQYIEDQANAIAGRMMRAYGKIDRHIYE